MNISLLYVGDVGDAWFNSTKHWNILNGLCNRSALVNLIDISDVGQRRLLRQIDGEAFQKKNIITAQERVFSATEEFKPDVIWFEKPLMFDAPFLKSIKQFTSRPFLICRQDDNPFGSRSYESLFWKRFIEAIPLYDLHLVKRQVDKVNFSKCGAYNTEFFYSGYDEKEFYQPTHLTDKIFDFSFVGTNFENRSNFLFSLALKLNSRNFLISGQRWNRSFIKLAMPKHVSSGIIEDNELRDLIQKSHASLGLFSLSNGDEFSGRAFQIAASGGVLVAPRSKMHEFFFKDGKEAFFYNDLQECSNIITKLIKNPSMANELGRNAAIRSINSGYSLQARLRQAVYTIKALA